MLFIFLMLQWKGCVGYLPLRKRGPLTFVVYWYFLGSTFVKNSPGRAGYNVYVCQSQKCTHSALGSGVGWGAGFACV